MTGIVWKEENSECLGHAMKGADILTLHIYPETYDGIHFFTMRSLGPDFGLDMDVHFDTLDKVKAYAQGVADAWQEDVPNNA